MNMKKRCLILVLLSVFLGLAGFAEEQKPLRRSIYMEFWGPSNLYGIAYDAGIKPGSRFGYRAGFAYLCDPDFCFSKTGIVNGCTVYRWKPIACWGNGAANSKWPWG